MMRQRVDAKIKQSLHGAPIGNTRHRSRPEEPIAALTALRVLLLAIGILGASLGKGARKNGIEFGFYPSPLELLIANGRYIALLTLALFVLLTYLAPVKARVRRLYSLGMIVLFSHFLFFAKMFYTGGDDDFLLAASGTFLLVFWAGFGVITTPGAVRRLVIPAVFLFAVAFLALNLFAFFLYPTASQTDFGRFFGVMANPQHLAMTAALAFPVTLAIATDRAATLWLRGGGIFVSAGLAYLVFLSQSRTGALAIVTAVAVTGALARQIHWGGVLSISGALVLAGLSGFLDPAMEGLLGSFVEGRENTRHGAWSEALHRFLESPVFGAPLDVNNRVVLTESLWLSLLSGGGSLGIILCASLIGRTVILVARLAGKLSVFDGAARRDAILLNAAALMILVIATFEAVFLGILTSMTILCLLYYAGLEAYSKTSAAHTGSVMRNSAAFPSKRTTGVVTREQ